MSGGTAILTMADLNLVQVRTLVDETDIGKIQPGLAATVTVDAYPNRPFQGEVLKVEPLAEVQQNVTMFPVIVRIENRDGLLRPGMNAERILIGSECIGDAKWFIERATAYAKEREQFGRPIYEFQGLQWMLADMASRTAGSGRPLQPPDWAGTAVWWATGPFRHLQDRFPDRGRGLVGLARRPP